MLVLCAFFLQPIVKTYSFLTDASYELVDYDVEDDSEKETKDTSEKDEKVTHNSVHFMLANTNLSVLDTHFYMQRIGLSYNIEILIPPPEIGSSISIYTLI
ncbi:hypothetical protein C8N46_11282 [Kordia periserrulae]|uniref:Uncharacterized protein n=2 Tax=Kordia periserrulae TaxID=701523 RepID=A0A2T6BRU8_9FLAO|nr:hypothetical protein C8N46_11282 [Kordia periserrulae]